MMIDGETLTIPLETDRDGVRELYDFIRPRLEYIETVEVEGNELASSLMLAFLVALKRSKPSLSIPWLERREALFERFGMMYWICHE